MSGADIDLCVFSSNTVTLSFDVACSSSVIRNLRSDAGSASRYYPTRTKPKRVLSLDCALQCKSACLDAMADADANAGRAGSFLSQVQSYVPVLKEKNPRGPHERAHDGQGPRPLTVEEVQAHPEYPHVHWKLEPDTKGKVEVGKGRGGPFKIAYEIHGGGPRKIIVRFRPVLIPV